MGRDAFFAFLRHNRLLVKKTKRYHVTTDSKHGFYKSPNRLKDLTPTHAEQVWVSDITYVKIQQNHAYVALVTDVYSKKIMGYKIDMNMKATLVKEALQMALKNRLYSHQNIIHQVTEEFNIAARNSPIMHKTMACCLAQRKSMIRMKTL
jgi:transposase InsO family protein